MDGVAELAGHQPVEDDLGNGLLTLLGLAPSFQPDDFRHQLLLVPGQLHIGIPGLTVGLLLGVDEGLLGHFADIKVPAAVIAKKKILFFEAFLKAPFQIPFFVVGSVGVGYHVFSVLGHAVQDDEMLGLREDGQVIHQKNGDVALLHGGENLPDVIRLMDGHLHLLGTVFHTLDVIFAVAAEVARQLIGQIGVAGEVGGNHGQGGNSAAAGCDGAGAEPLVGVVQLVIEGEAVDRFDLRGRRGGRLRFLRLGALRCLCGGGSDLRLRSGGGFRGLCGFLRRVCDGGVYSFLDVGFRGRVNVVVRMDGDQASAQKGKYAHQRKYLFAKGHFRMIPPFRAGTHCQNERVQYNTNPCGWLSLIS